MIISILLNVITLAIVAAFAMVIYMAYRKRPDPTSTVGDVIRDIFYSPKYPTSIYGIVPFKKGLMGPIGEFGEYSSEEYSDLIGNSYNYKQGEKPWQGTDLSDNVINLSPEELIKRQELIQNLEKTYGEDVGFDNISQNDPEFKNKINNLIKQLS